MTATMTVENLYYKRWEPTGEPKAVVLLVHGMAEHCGRYAHLGEYLNGAGYALAGLDLPGHGQSPGTPGYIDKFAEFTQAVQALRHRVGQWYPDKPVYLLGHSMGGLIAGTVLLDHQQDYAGCILSGPAIQSPLQPGFIQMLMIRLFALITPRKGVMQLDANGVSRDPKVVADYLADPLVYSGSISARMLLEIFTAMSDLQAAVSAIDIPLLLLHGSADSLTAVAGSQLMHDKCGSTDKTLKIYDGLFHEVFNEPEHLQIFSEVVNWLDGQLQGC